jgi:type II secretory pathway pseudopilin PulG
LLVAKGEGSDVALGGHNSKMNKDVLPARRGEEGYLLLGAIVAIALVMIALSVAAVKVSFALRREREVESMRRAEQYVRAIREYYLKFGRYPGSVDQLVNTNNIRFLRQKYVDPLTGKADYRLIIVGQNKTTPKGFFGEALSGLSGTGPGAGAGGGMGNNSAANGLGVNGLGANGANSAQSGSANTATMGFGGVAPQGTQANGPGTSSMQGTGLQGPGSQNGPSATTGSGGPGTGGSGSGGPGSNLGPIMGVGTSATGNSILTVNEQTTYDTWEFLYDPRVERLRQLGQLNSGVGSAGPGGNPAGLGGATPVGAAPGAGTNGAGAPSGQPGQSPGNGSQPNGALPNQP